MLLRIFGKSLSFWLLCTVLCCLGQETKLIAPAKKEGKWGYIDQKGNWIIFPEYLAAKDFDHNLGEVIYYDSEGDDYRTKFINLSNETVFRLPELNYSAFSEGYLAYKEADLFGYMDSTGKKVIPAQFNYCSSFSRGLAAVVFRTGKTGFINTAKQLLIAPRYDTAFDFHGNFAVVGKKDKATKVWKYGVIDQYGNIIIPFIYEWITNFSEKKAFANSGGKIKEHLITGGSWKILDLKTINTIDLEDTTLIVEIDNHKALPWLRFSEGISWFPQRVGNKIVMRLLDTKGKWVSDKQYHVVNAISEGLAGVFEGKMGFVDLKGKLVIPCKFGAVGDFHEGLAKVKIGNKFGFVNHNGDIVIQTIFEDAGDFVKIKSVSKKAAAGK